MNRRTFVKLSGVALAAAGAQPTLADSCGGGAKPFKIKFAPHPGLLTPKKMDYMDQLKFSWDHGFTAWEDNGFMGKPVELKEKVASFMQDKGIEFGVTVVTNCGGERMFDCSKDGQERILGNVRSAVEQSKITGQKWYTYVPGSRDESRPIGEQLKGSVDLMKRCCDIADKAGIVFALEPLSHPVAKKPVLLRTFQEGYELCELVNRPSCKLLADYYHQQQTHGDLIKSTDECWKHIEYIQYGDVPGRKQPGTGEINHLNLTRHILKKGFTGIFGMEHGALGGPEPCIKAYREIDDAIAAG